MTAVALILAAGEGTRMKSELPKAAHPVLGVPMVCLVAEAARSAGCERLVVVTGHGAERVESVLDGVVFARQDRQLGTGHAVMCAEGALSGLDGSLLVLSGDSPLIRPETLVRLVEAREGAGAAMSVLTTFVHDPGAYGRVVRDAEGALLRIVEEKDCTPREAAVSEINTGFYCFDAQVLLEHLHRLESDNAQGEYYLTDMVGVLLEEGLGVEVVVTDEPGETLGVNSRVQLAEASKALQRRVNTAHMLAGATMTDPDLVWISPNVTLGRDVVVEPMTFLFGATTVGDRAILGPDTRVTDSRIGEGATVDSSVVTGADVGPGAIVGPRAYLRAGTVLDAGAKVGTCVEIKNSRVGPGSKVPHLSYIGDATIGAGVNIGAGTITCNYDGVDKHPTVIRDGAFLGSDTMLVAPVEIGEDAVTGAGSTISSDVPSGSLAVERTELRIVEGWVEKRRRRRGTGEQG